MKIGDELLFNPDGRWEEWRWSPRIGEKVRITNVQARHALDTGLVNGELVDFVSLDTGAIYERVSVEWFQGKDEAFE